MKFDELPLYCAIHRVRERIKYTSECGQGDSVSSSFWERGEGAVELTKMIAEELVTTQNDLYVSAFVRYRKSQNTDSDGQKKLDIIAQLCSDTPECFYKNRGLGPCSDEVDLDRILPGSKGGEYTVANCVLSCSTHNRQRGDRDFVDYLAGELHGVR